MATKTTTTRRTSPTRAAKKPAETKLVFVKERETKNMIRYQEVVQNGDERGVIGTLYVNKSVAEGKDALVVTIRQATPEDVE